ncbi:hypothetical protein Tsubulata_046439 [Turnera subulata]|uniref:F-box domain-containing protein n=1 Tax=Turnera subulata TaxID=218843 RepID=A0A9Q0FBF7_9ROSI|nr:hypothetical protein Tsubulata_046439 [Turnera subulata]
MITKCKLKTSFHQDRLLLQVTRRLHHRRRGPGGSVFQHATSVSGAALQHLCRCGSIGFWPWVVKRLGGCWLQQDGGSDFPIQRCFPLWGDIVTSGSSNSQSAIPLIHSSSVKEASVKDCLSGGDPFWTVSWRRQLRVWERVEMEQIKTAVAGATLQLSREDSRIWGNSRDGQYSTGSATILRLPSEILEAILEMLPNESLHRFRKLPHPEAMSCAGYDTNCAYGFRYDWAANDYKVPGKEWKILTNTCKILEKRTGSPSGGCTSLGEERC